MSALPEPTTPVVTPADVSDDLQFFADHPWCNFRVGDHWILRRRHGGVFLRAPRPAGGRFVDTEPSAAAAWFEAAWPDLDPLERAAMAKRARIKKGKKI